MNRIYRLLAIVLLISATLTIHAQSGDKLFMEGQRLQQTMTVASQSAAIKKFQAAKVVYTTADKKKMCDNQIIICSRNISSLKGGGKAKSSRKKSSPQEEKVKLSLSQNRIEFDGDQAGVANVKVEATSTDWNFTVPVGVNGSDDFAKVSRSNDAKSINIAVVANPQTLVREQVINVDLDDCRETITIIQRGKPVTLSTSKSVLEFGLKGGNKSLELYTNSDSIIADNNNLTWYIESKPDWVETGVEVKKKKGIFGAGLSVIKGLVSGTSAAASQTDTKTSHIKIIVSPIPKGSSEASSGRKGEIIFASQEQRYKVTILQQ